MVTFNYSIFPISTKKYFKKSKFKIGIKVNKLNFNHGKSWKERPNKGTNIHSKQIFISYLNYIYIYIYIYIYFANVLLQVI